MNVYMKGGTYSVTLLASNGFGSDIEVKKDLITVYQTFPGQKRPPGDIDADGKFEDLNGDRQLNKDDYNLFIKNFKWIRNNEPVTLFDYSNNNRIDDLDIILLKREIISKS
jgi:PKD repeat protein